MPKKSPWGTGRVDTGGLHRESSYTLESDASRHAAEIEKIGYTAKVVREYESEEGWIFAVYTNWFGFESKPMKRIPPREPGSLAEYFGQPVPGRRELLPDELFTKLDRAHSSLREVFLFLSRQEHYQHQAAELGTIAEQLNAFTKRLARGA